MKTEWLCRRGNNALIVLCNGWGMDARPFSALESSAYDVLVCSDYSTELGLPDIDELSTMYSRCILLSWSMGVSYGQRVFAGVADRFAGRIAVNGTLCPIDDDCGIPRAVFRATLDNLSTESLQKFYRRMCGSGKNLEIFLENLPERSLDGQRRELEIILQEAGQIEEVQSIYTHVVVSRKDRIVPSRNQYNFWRTSTIKAIEGSHFPFYRWKSWDDVIESIVT